MKRLTTQCGAMIAPDGEGRSNNARVSFQLRRANGSWVIEGVK
jgi:hypothetical protein